MANITVTFTITEFCLHTGVTEEELNEIVGLGVIEHYNIHYRPIFTPRLKYKNVIECKQNKSIK